MKFSRFFILLIAFFCLKNSVFAQKNTDSPDAMPPPSMSVTLLAADTIVLPFPTTESQYEGLRLQMSDLRAIKRLKKTIKFKSTLVNTGRLPVNLGKNRKPADALPLILLDTVALAENGLKDYQDQIRYAILQLPIKLGEGKTIQELNIEILIVANKNLVIAENKIEKPNKKLEKTTDKPVEKKKETFSDESAMFEISTPKASDVVKNSDNPKFFGHATSPVDTILPTGFTSFEEAEREVLRLDSLENAKIVAAERDKKNRDTKNLLKPSAPDKIDKTMPKEEKTATKEVKKIEKTAPPQYPILKETKKEEKVAEKLPAKTESVKGDTVPSSGFVEEKVDLSTGCVDLTIDGVRILESNEKTIKVEFNLFNNGNKAVNIYGETRKLEDNVAVRFYASGTQRLTRGSLIVDGIFINDGLKDTKGMLEPKKGIKLTYKISAEKFTRFNKVMILQIDGFDVVRECDETNNVNYVFVK